LPILRLICTCPLSAETLLSLSIRHKIKHTDHNCTNYCKQKFMHHSNSIKLFYIESESLLNLDNLYKFIFGKFALFMLPKLQSISGTISASHINEHTINSSIQNRTKNLHQTKLLKQSTL
jgi:hypothetical protein